jgi:hypothetical protein
MNSESLNTLPQNEINSALYDTLIEVADDVKTINRELNDIHKDQDKITTELEDKVDHDDMEEAIKDLRHEFADEFMSEADVERWVSDNLDEYMTESDVERWAENALPDFDDFVEKDDLQSAIEEALDELDLVQKAASGAAIGAIRAMATYVSKDDLARESSALRELAWGWLEDYRKMHNLNFFGRLRWLFTGRL